MRRSFSYIGLLLATVTGLFIAGNEPVSQVNNRIIAVHVSKEKDFSSTAPEVRAGSIDLLVDEGTSLHLLGWVSPFVDEIIMIPRAKAPNYVLELMWPILWARKSTFGPGLTSWCQIPPLRQ